MQGCPQKMKIRWRPKNAQIPQAGLVHACIVCEAKAWLGGRVDKRSMKNRPSNLQGGEDYLRVSKLDLAEREMDRLFNDDR